MVAVDGSRKAVLAAMFANAGIAIAKFVAFLVTGASSMLAESIHSVADTSNQGLLLYGAGRARREATAAHSFGYGRERYFWSFVVALLLFSMGGLFALYEGIEKLRHADEHGLESPAVAIAVLVFAIILESFSFRTAIVEANKVRGGRTWTQFVRTAKTPELPVVLLEDAGAMLGLVLALIGVVTATITHDPAWDAVGTISIGVLLIVIAIVLAIEMKSLLIGESVERATEDRIRIAIESVPGIRRLIHMRTQYMGPDEVLVAGKVELDRGSDFPAIADAIDTAEANVRAEVPNVEFIYLEPDIFDPARPGPSEREASSDPDEDEDRAAH